VYFHHFTRIRNHVTSGLRQRVGIGLGLWMLAATLYGGTLSVSVVPSKVNLLAGSQQHFGVIVGGTLNQAVTWRVNGIVGGNSTVGTVTSSGTYSAPALPPTANTFTVTATSNQDSKTSNSAAVTILNPQPAVTGITPSTIPIGSFKITIAGTGFAPGAQVSFAGSPLTTTYVSTSKLTATGTAQALTGQVAAVTVANPAPGPLVSNLVVVSVAPANALVSADAAARFLGQASWGPDAASIAHVQQVGFSGYLAEQFATPPSTYPNFPDSMVTYLAPVEAQFLVNAISGPDQLRQRVAFALSEILVVSGYKEFLPSRMTPYVSLVLNDAFSNYETVMQDVALSPTMGDFLGMVQNAKANPAAGTAPNENFAREFLQLFTIGLEDLNLDGTPQLGSSGNPIPTYNQTTISNFAKVFTGWTYPTQPGATPLAQNPAYFAGPMIPVNSLHDTTSKTLLNGVVLPAGNGSEQDLVAALQNVFAHPNVAPFISRRLIQSLVTSNPSPAYVSRVAAVFNSNASGVRGDLKAVVTAILLDPEARQGDAPGSATNTQGHLMEPVLYAAALSRALEGTAAANNMVAGFLTNMGELLFYPQSVFNYFPPSYQIPGTNLNGPEYQILTPSAAVQRANFAGCLAWTPKAAGLNVDLTALTALAADPPSLLNALNLSLMRGQMSSQMQTAVLNSLAALGSYQGQALNQVRAQTAIYLVASSSQYQVLR
jgi:uncharacterized protein (DUF1800 family)